ncbi:MAG: DUF2752 domain-containing protein [bacterium]
METYQKLRSVVRWLNLEVCIWLLGLMYLALLNPSTSTHLHFCGFQLLGFERCPGCGLGLSISFLLHGDLSASWRTHPLGIFALIILILRILAIFRQTAVRS